MIMFLELLLVIGAIALSAGLMFLRQGAPYVPTTDDDAFKIAELACKYGSMNIVDLGSGNGKLVKELAKQGFKTTGIEINPLLVSESKKAIKASKLQRKAKILRGNFWSKNLSNYDTVVLYGIKHIMPRLEKKLIKELDEGSIIISNFFVFPRLKPIEKSDRINIYKITDKSKSLLKSN